MQAHQVITGALNQGDNVFAVGSVEGVNFAVCAVGCDVVILASDFERVQIIAGSSFGNAQVGCVDCCADTGRIAAAFADCVRIFEPTPLAQHSSAHVSGGGDGALVRSAVQRLDYRWFETARVSADGPVRRLSWSLEGLRLLVGMAGGRLQLFQHAHLLARHQSLQPVADDYAAMESHWTCVWSTRLPTEVAHMRFSPDGSAFVTAGPDDRLVKVWYQEQASSVDGWSVSFGFIYLAHPHAVTGFEWRKTGRYMPRHCCANALITWCRDNCSRIWCETAVACDRGVAGETVNDGCFGGGVDQSATNKRADVPERQHKLKSTRLKVTQRLKHLRHLKSKQKQLDLSESGTLEKERSNGAISDVSTADPVLHFHLAATINADTDCFQLVPSLGARAEAAFSVHWLNNKELSFSLGAEKLLTEALSSDELWARRSPQPLAAASEGRRLSAQTSADSLEQPALTGDSGATVAASSGGQLTPDSSASRASTDEGAYRKDMFDLRLEALLRRWLQRADVLFAIHPVDGSLLVWTLEWLDDVCRQPVVSFSSRTPHAFPLSDATSLQQNFVTFNPHDPAFVSKLQRSHLAASTSDDTSQQLESSNSLFLLTNHLNGSLNLWNMTLDTKSDFSTIQSVAHKSRMCGHRFRMSRIVCHPVLPLLLTTGHHALAAADAPDASNAELILWKVGAVGPLCKSGGVRELSRTMSERADAFRNLAWVPSVLPSSALGSVCKSPSSCFVATDGQSLRLYQAVIDAKSLLAEIAAEASRASTESFDEKLLSLSGSSGGDSEPHAFAAEMQLNGLFDVISTQSTGRPGCMIRLDSLCKSEDVAQNLALLHVFHENTMFPNTSTADSKDGVGGARPFAHRYFVVALHGERLRMWSLTIASQQASPLSGGVVEVQSSPELESVGFSSAVAAKTTHSAAALRVTTLPVFDASLAVPRGVQITGANPAAGHLPSSSLYPAYCAPYLLVTPCSDDLLRFWRCDRGADSNDFTWTEWRMISGNRNSVVELEGSVLTTSSAHSSRLACAYEPLGCRPPPRDESAETLNVDVVVFECESTGGVDWLQEDLLRLRDIRLPTAARPSLRDFNFGHNAARSPVDEIIFDWQSTGAKHHLLQRIPSVPRMPSTDMRRVVSGHALRSLSSSANGRPPLVRVDWVSTEDGAHILTVGVGSRLFFYAPVSEDVAQQNVLIMSESRKRPTLQKASSLAAQPSGRSLVRWVPLRSLELRSADGLPPLPVMVGWVRNGVLVVGMESEMRVYNQWGLELPEAKQRNPNAAAISESSSSAASLAVPPRLLSVPAVPSGQLHISPSMSLLDLAKRTPSRSQSRPVAVAPPPTAGSEALVAIMGDEGLFEAARLASPLLPQYHPRQLMQLLNAGRTRRVKAILLHVLGAMRTRNVVVPSTLPRQGSMRRSKQSSAELESPRMRSMSIHPGGLAEDVVLDYDEIDSIPPLPLWALLAADTDAQTTADVANGSSNTTAKYDDLFNGVVGDVGDDLNAVLDDYGEEDEEADGEGRATGRRRTLSVASDHEGRPNDFTAKHNRLLTRYLTHVHLPGTSEGVRLVERRHGLGLSSVDQMHLLAVADTLSHFSSDVMDRLTAANSAPSTAAMVDSSAGGGYARVGAAVDGAVEAVDECGLRYLMALKQHEYLLLCLPMSQRQVLRGSGLSSAHVIWALHSETQTELLNAVPSLQRAQPSWPELRALGVGWWLANTATLRLCVEKVAKSAFQRNNDPMEAALYYLALRKKNVLTHLFKSARNMKMADFFCQNFDDAKWRKAALKNAFVLMGKQRFSDAAAFFLLAGHLKDAIQTCLTNLNDLQLAVVLVRLYESDADEQSALLRQMLCREVLGCDSDDLPPADSDDANELAPTASRDPFLRSMAFWHLRDYARSASTLLDQAADLDALDSHSTLSDVFNFYSYLRTHTLVIRQRLSAAGVQIGSTEKLLSVTKRLGELVTPAERRLYFRTAVATLKSGCPLLALDVLSRLPKGLAPASADSQFLSCFVGTDSRRQSNASRAQSFDWGAPAVGTQPPAARFDNDEPLKLKWSDDEASGEDEEEAGLIMKPPPALVELNGVSESDCQPTSEKIAVVDTQASLPLDVIAQQLKFVCSLKILTEELATLASGTDVECGQLRLELYVWLENEVAVLKRICDYNVGGSEAVGSDADASYEFDGAPSEPRDGALHESLKIDRADMQERLEQAVRRRCWLADNQELLRALTSYCALHGAQGVGLAAVRMELLLLLQELDEDSVASGVRQLAGLRGSRLANASDASTVAAPMPTTDAVPLFASSVGSFKATESGPLSYVKNQAYDILATVAEMSSPPRIDTMLGKTYLLYNLCQCVSSCVFESLSDLEGLVDYRSNTFEKLTSNGYLLRRPRAASTKRSTATADVSTLPSKWPGVRNMAAALLRGRDAEDSPRLLLLLVDSFVAVYSSLFAYALCAYDSRWLFRLSAHTLSPRMFASVFGGGADAPPNAAAKPTRTPRYGLAAVAVARAVGPPPLHQPRDSASALAIDRAAVDPAAMRAKFHARVFGSNSPSVDKHSGLHSDDKSAAKWVPPRTGIVAYFMAKPASAISDDLGVDYDSDEPLDAADSDSEENESVVGAVSREHIDPDGYAWAILRLALVKHISHRIRQFVSMCGIASEDLPSCCPRTADVMHTLERWQWQLEATRDRLACPAAFLPRSNVAPSSGASGSSGAPSLHKYRMILDAANTPFETDDPTALPVRRLWLFLVRQEHLMDIFIRSIFRSSKVRPAESDSGVVDVTADAVSELPQPIQIVQREQEAITAFALCACKPGWLVVATDRELQEMDCSAVLSGAPGWLNDAAELDVALAGMPREPLRDNDDFLLYSSAEQKESSSFLCKRQVAGIRRMDAHASLPYYVSGAADGSVRVWEWGVGQPLYSPRPAAQFAKATSVRFAPTGNKFGSTDVDGFVSIWQIARGTPIKKPSFSVKCHTKSASDFQFLGTSSSLLATAGHGSGDGNLALFDTLLPHNHACIQSWTCHPEGAACVLYLPQQLTLVSGGKQGDLCFWDLRQRQLRSSLRAFEHAAVRSLAADGAGELFAAGSADGDVRVWSGGDGVQLLCALPTEHAGRGGFSLRHGHVQGVQQLLIDADLRLFSCGADCALRARALPRLLHSL